MTDKNLDLTKTPPFETKDLRANLKAFLEIAFPDPNGPALGSYRCGVYAFYDYDGEPIYIGQTKEKVSTRIRRHLTNQRTDAVAMSVLDPFEVYEIEVWPLPQFQDPKLKESARQYLDALEYKVYHNAVAASEFRAVLNEKDPPRPITDVAVPLSVRRRVVSQDVHAIRSHPDFRIARRALIISRLAQVISERQVQAGLRRVLLTQAKRLQWLAERRFEALGGAAAVEADNPDDETSE